MDLKVTEVLDTGNDVLLVRGYDGDETLEEGAEPTVLEATGWVSATTNHFDPAAYSTDAEGNLERDEKAKPRPMTPAEVGDYAHTLLLEQHPDPAAAAPAPPTPISFS